MLAAGLWMLGQVMDAVVEFGRDFVNFPGYSGVVNVWLYHDLAFTLLWGSFALIALWDIRAPRPGQLTTGRVLIILFGFALLTAGLWISQDLMDSALLLHRPFVDLPFFVASLDLLQTRDLVLVLTTLAFVSYYVLNKVVADTPRPEPRA